MNGLEHYREAEALLNQSAALAAGELGKFSGEALVAAEAALHARAQVHATLALAAATAATRYTHVGQFDGGSSTTFPAGWAEVVEP